MEWIVTVIIVALSIAYVTWRWVRAGQHLARKDRKIAGCACTDGCPQADKGIATKDSCPGRSALLTAALILLSSGVVSAADTIETWEQGATDVDFYLSMDGVGKSAADRVLSADIMVGYGILNGLSAYLGTAIGADGALANGEPTLYLGTFGTPLDTDHLDLDLMLGFDLSGPEMNVFGVAPGIEFVYTEHPEMWTWGLYFRSFAGLGPSIDEPTGEADGIRLDLTGTVGAFYTLAERHQLLLELDGTWRPRGSEDRLGRELGGIALGYNVVLTDALELINQVYFDVSNTGEDFAVGFTVGFIATIPPARG